jgi:hypothetical protein
LHQCRLALWTLVMPGAEGMRLTDPAIPIHRITTGFFASPLPCASGPVDGPASCSVFDMIARLLYMTYQQHSYSSIAASEISYTSTSTATLVVSSGFSGQ